MKISEVVSSLSFFLTAPKTFLLIECCHCSLSKNLFQHYVSGLFIDTLMVLTVNDTNCRMSHSCAIFTDPDILSGELGCCGTLLSS